MCVSTCIEHRGRDTLTARTATQQVAPHTSDCTARTSRGKINKRKPPIDTAAQHCKNVKLQTSALSPYRQESIARPLARRRRRRRPRGGVIPLADSDRVLSRHQAAPDRRRLAAVEPGQESLARLGDAQQRVSGGSAGRSHVVVGLFVVAALLGWRSLLFWRSP